MKVVINACYGGFGLSKEAEEFLHYNGIVLDNWNYDGRDFRSNPVLIECVETLGKKVNTDYSDLKIVEIPDDVEWEITEYDGWEQIEEVHRIWD
jgi:hypothetical protein